MAALSIAIVTGEARKLVSPYLTLVRLSQENCFEWIFDDGSKRTLQRVPTDKIRGLKLDEWLRYARGLADGKAVEGAPQIASAPKAVPTEKNPHFMLIRQSEKPVPFDPNPEVQGYRDATRGFTACPYGLKHQIEKWNKGHDQAYADGKAEKPRFGLKVRGRN
jgi:hypothetical protein